jgi:RNA polymerase sigma-70 factor (ECF subfamily)
MPTSRETALCPAIAVRPGNFFFPLSCQNLNKRTPILNNATNECKKSHSARKFRFGSDSTIPESLALRGLVNHHSMDDVQREPDHHVTERLIAWCNGDSEALGEVMRSVYDELHLLAERYLRKERSDHTLQPTALVNEAYLRLVDQTRANWQNRNQFLGVAARMMRRILVDHARTKYREKRGGNIRQLSLNEIAHLQKNAIPDLAALDDALNCLHEIDPRKGQVVELRFFGGLSVEETAEVLGVSPKTVLRDWKMAKAWLYQEMTRAEQ